MIIVFLHVQDYNVWYCVQDYLIVLLNVTFVNYLIPYVSGNGTPNFIDR